MPPWQRKKCQKEGKNQEKERKNREKNREKEEKSGRKGQNREGSFTLPLLTNRAGYATDWWGHLSIHPEVPISFSLAIGPHYSRYNAIMRGSPILCTMSLNENTNQIWQFRIGQIIMVLFHHLDNIFLKVYLPNRNATLLLHEAWKVSIT